MESRIAVPPGVGLDDPATEHFDVRVERDEEEHTGGRRILDRVWRTPSRMVRGAAGFAGALTSALLTDTTPNSDVSRRLTGPVRLVVAWRHGSEIAVYRYARTEAAGLTHHLGALRDRLGACSVREFLDTLE